MQKKADIQITKAGEWTTSIFDVAGKVVRSEQRSLEVGWQQLQYDLTDLKAGTYFVKLEGNGDRIYRKVIVQ